MLRCDLVFWLNTFRTSTACDIRKKINYRNFINYKILNKFLLIPPKLSKHIRILVEADVLIKRFELSPLNEDPGILLNT